MEFYIRSNIRNTLSSSVPFNEKSHDYYFFIYHVLAFYDENLFVATIFKSHNFLFRQFFDIFKSTLGWSKLISCKNSNILRKNQITNFLHLSPFFMQNIPGLFLYIYIYNIVVICLRG